MSPGKAGKRPLRSLTVHEKLDAIRRVHDGESKASVARDIGVPESTLRGWCKNEDKISYLSRQSSPETDESSLPSYEPKEKKRKLDDTTTKLSTPTTGIIAPFNLNIKQTLPYSANEDAIKIPAESSIVNNINTPLSTSSTIPMNLTTSSSLLADVAIKSNVTNDSSSIMGEREKNRAELARLSVELGLNRPEMFLPGANASNGSAADISTNISLLAHQWKNILLQQQIIKSSTTMTSNKPKQSKVDPTSTAAISQMQNYTKLMDTKKLHKGEPIKSVEDNVWSWLKTQQAILGLTQNMQQTGTLNNNSTQSSVLTSTSRASNSIVPTSIPPSLPLKPTSTGFDLNNSSWFWKWYKQYTSQLQNVQIAATPTNKLILSQQLTKMNNENLETAAEAEQPIPNKNGISMMPPVAAAVSASSASSNKSRSVLDSILLNNNNVSEQDQKEGKEDYISQSEALEHGEKFLRWLERCSEPSVTAMQIMQFRSLINNIKTSSDRKNSEQKTKVRRK